MVRMKLNESSLSRNLGVPRTTLQAILAGGGVTVDTAARIVEATGGMVGFMDLLSRPK